MDTEEIIEMITMKEVEVDLEKDIIHKILEGMNEVVLVGLDQDQ